MSKKLLQEQILAQLEIGSDLSREFTRQSGYFASWGFLAARAMDRVRQLEEQSELVFSTLYAAYRVRASKDKQKENDCKASIRTNKHYRQIQQELLEAKHNHDILKVAMEAFSMRRDMLMQLGALNRAELTSTDLHMKAKRAGEVLKKKIKRRLEK